MSYVTLRKSMAVAQVTELAEVVEVNRVFLHFIRMTGGKQKTSKLGSKTRPNSEVKHVQTRFFYFICYSKMEYYKKSLQTSFMRRLIATSPEFIGRSTY